MYLLLQLLHFSEWFSEVTRNDRRDLQTHYCSLVIRHKHADNRCFSLCPSEVRHSVHEVILPTGTTLLLLVDGN